MTTSTVYPAHPEQILKALGKLWTSRAEEEKEQGKPTILRACAMNLIVATDEPDGGFAASQIISELMREHPSRGIVLAISETAEKGLQGRVLAQCWKPFGKAQQICCEQIEITATPENWPNIGPTIIGIMAADLPVVLWCRLKAAFNPAATSDEKAGLEAVMPLATKVIADTKDDNPRTALRILNDWRTKGRLVADLEWTRLTLWREPIAQMFDNPARRNRLSEFHTIEIAYTEGSPRPCALYAGGWLSSGNRAGVSFITTSGYGPGIHRISLRSDSEVIEFERTSSECMTLRSSSGSERKYSFADPSLYTLMNEELSVLGADPAFEAAFTRALEIIE